jgi:FHA domain
VRAGANRVPRPAVRRPVQRKPAGNAASAGGVGVDSGESFAAGGMRAAVAGRGAGEVTPVEIPCPNCGEPMLPGWGTTCGKCRPNLVAPKTLFFSASDFGLPTQAQLSGGMTLGWLVVVRTVEESQQGNLIELDRPTVALSRAGVPPIGADKVVQFEDSFMSSGHAVLRSPPDGDRSNAFTISDRENPSPSINGTFVNADKVTAGQVVRLSDGDIIKVGATELLFKSLWLPPSGHQR